MAGSPLRFAVLHHTGVAEPHHDLLIELSPGAALATWRCDWPLSDDEKPATRQADHRRLYLQYEGPVSGGRGEVRRVAWGECRVCSLGDNEIEVDLGPGLLSVKLRRDAADRWWVSARVLPGNKSLA